MRKHQSSKRSDDVFISYRTSDGIDFAGRLKDRLAQKGFSVYYNPDKHTVGEPFPEYLKNAVEACKVFLIVVTPNLVSGLIQNFISGEDDYVRDELETAMKSGKKIIPILRGADMPQDKLLPDKIKGFSVIDSIEVNSKDASDFNYGIKKVVKKVKEHCSSRRETILKTASAFVGICLLAVAIILLPKLTHKRSSGVIPTLSVSGINTRTIVEKYGTLTFIVNAENSGVALSKESISLMGFDADIDILTLSESESVINLSSIVSDIDCDNYIVLNSGAITNPDGQQSAETASKKFTVCEKGACTNPIVSINRDSSDADYNPQETITFFISATDDTKVSGFDISAEDVLLYGFTGNIEILQDEGSTKRISISEITVESGASEDNMRICIECGVCFDEEGNESAAVCSEPFRISDDVQFAYFSISPPSVDFVEDGGGVSFTATPVGSEAFDYLSEPKVGTIGFDGDVTLTKNGSDYVINICNIQNAHDTVDKAISISGLIGLQFTEKTYSGIFQMKEDTSRPILSIGVAQPKEIKSGGTVQYPISFGDDDNNKVNFSNMLEQKITPVGFEADITVEKSNENVLVVTFSGVRSTSESLAKRFILEEGAATDSSNNPTKELTSPSFHIVY